MRVVKLFLFFIGSWEAFKDEASQQSFNIADTGDIWAVKSWHVLWDSLVAEWIFNGLSRELSQDSGIQ